MNATPGVDRTIKVVDIGPENFAVGVIHRGATGGAARGAAPAGGGGGGAARRCRGRGRAGGTLRRAIDGAGDRRRPRHDRARSADRRLPDISGSGTLVTGGKIVNGSKSAPEGRSPKSSTDRRAAAQSVGADLVKKVVKTGDIIIIPAGVPHGWTEIADHVDYLSFRPSARVLQAGYTHPSIKK